LLGNDYDQMALLSGVFSLNPNACCREGLGEKSIDRGTFT